MQLAMELIRERLEKLESSTGRGDSPSSRSKLADQMRRRWAEARAQGLTKLPTRKPEKKAPPKKKA
jgi:hypothetical protein